MLLAIYNRYLFKTFIRSIIKCIHGQSIHYGEFIVGKLFVA